MATVKGLLKGLRYITQIFDEDKDKDMQIGFPTDVKHVAHIGSDGPATNTTPSWMGDFKPQENENAQVVSRGDANNNNQIGEGVGLQELLPPPEKPKHKKTRRKSETVSQNGSPPRRNSSASASDMQPKNSRRHHRSRHGSIDSSHDPSVRRRRVVSVATDMEGSYPLSDGSSTTRKSTTRHRKPKGSGGGGELSMKKTKGKTDIPIVQSVDKCNDSISDKD
ncbi:PREDICTED: CRIB domain-containing protein RIC3-like [Camelina sativa]|uniref:CRIB domain-containing protein RIC3-like n=1 Tax=Camelina sativa TaxID=90675 RepID=A0ABM0WRG2_CAMSA|nr:PREDICTED: CRIB domain-containing protein RIC3-like [Camelina sativa]